MRKILIFGNSGSGKSTLAKRLSDENDLVHLDLDLFAWLPGSPPRRMPLSESSEKIATCLKGRDSWVVEGCYTDLLEILAKDASEMLFMDLSIEKCIANAKNRPWEPHKYESKEAQDANLDMLVSWIKEYDTRLDTFSRAAHRELFAAFQGKKTLYTENQVHD
ncbi:shikimate kinase [Microbulbifer agarilyticus]|uniref:Shikimate kinase n=1 Tax=Microbulbifer agarilyticus TaxID=260552 RepID=A0A1Q2MA90_9GAMM|nr:shikimate kinase [Microbulbifer agarilyticus]